MRGVESAVKKLREHYCDSRDSELIGEMYEIAADHVEVAEGHMAREACSSDELDDVAADILESIVAGEKARRG